MSSEQQAVTETGVEVVCGATATYCHCVKPAGHVAAGDEVHACDPSECTGQWAGEYGGNDWTPVTMPMPVSS